MATPKTFTTRIGLAPETRAKMMALLNQQLAATFDLYSQIKQAHWNVKGAQFFQLHEQPAGNKAESSKFQRLRAFSDKAGRSIFYIFTTDTDDAY
jgi:hypothetical protein